VSGIDVINGQLKIKKNVKKRKKRGKKIKKRLQTFDKKRCQNLQSRTTLMLYRLMLTLRAHGIVGRFGPGFRNGCIIGSKEYALKGIG